MGALFCWLFGPAAFGAVPLSFVLLNFFYPGHSNGSFVLPFFFVQTFAFRLCVGWLTSPLSLALRLGLV